MKFLCALGGIPIRHHHLLGCDWRLLLSELGVLGACQCGYTTDPEKNCNGTHNVVEAVKADLAEK